MKKLFDKLINIEYSNPIILLKLFFIMISIYIVNTHISSGIKDDLLHKIINGEVFFISLLNFITYIIIILIISVIAMTLFTVLLYLIKESLVYKCENNFDKDGILLVLFGGIKINIKLLSVFLITIMTLFLYSKREFYLLKRSIFEVFDWIIYILIFLNIPSTLILFIEIIDSIPKELKRYGSKILKL